MFKIILFVLLASSTSFARILVDIKGPEIQIKKLLWLNEHRAQFLQSCLTDVNDCGRKDELLPVLQQVYSMLKGDKRSGIYFVHENEQPGLFTSDANETHRIATTGNAPGSPIYINGDRFKSLGLEQLLGILFHEYTHHLNIKDDAKRIPDQIGARIAKHVMKQLKISYYDEAKAPQLFSVVFQSFPPVNLDGSNGFYNFGLITDGTTLLNISFIEFEISPACDRPDAFPLAQLIENPMTWTRVTDSKVNLATPIGNLCVWVDKVKRTAGSDSVLRGFSMDFEINKDYQILTNTVNASLAKNQETVFDRLKTLQRIDTKLNKTNYDAGDLVEGTVTLKSFSSSQYTKCQLGISNSGSPVQTNGWPVVEKADCEIISGQNNIWTIRFRHQLGTIERQGEHYVSTILLSNADSKENAVATFLKKEITFNVNPNAKSVNPMEVTSVKALELAPIVNNRQFPFTDSYMYNDLSTWNLEVRVKSKLKITVRGIDARFMEAINGEVETVTQSGDLRDLGHYIKNTTYLTEGDTQIIRFTISLPAKDNGHAVLGLGLVGLIIQDEAKNYVDLVHKDKYQYWYVSKSLLDANR